MTSTTAPLSDPTWFPIGFDLKADTLTFLKTNRQTLSEAAFLDQRFYPAAPQTQAITLSTALQEVAQTAPINWIFHTAFCCSTLMARALDIPSKSLALKEPDILMQLANARRMSAQNGTSEGTLTALEGLVLNLLGRQFSPDEAIIIKPTNPANPLIDLAVSRGESCLFMVSSLEGFLISIIKKGEPCRSFVRTLYNIFALDPNSLSQIPQRQALTFTDLQIAALVWHHQVQHMTGSAQRGGSNIRAIDGNKLPIDPTPYLAAATRFFDLGWTDSEVTAQATGSVFQHNSKFDDQSYDASIRASEAKNIRETYAEAIEVTLKWAANINLGGTIKMLPAQSLL